MPELFDKEEIRWLKQASDLQGALSVLWSWGVIAVAFIAAALDPHPVIIAMAVVLIAGQQLGLAVLMHEASHRSLFRSRRLNDFAGRWLCGAPVWTHMDAYRTHHLSHHAYTNTERDPDMSLVSPFPVSRRSLARKLFRDISGLTGLKRVVGILLMDFGFLTYTASGNARRGPKMSLGARLRHAAPRIGAMLLANGALGAVLAASGHGWLYLLWAGSYLTVFSLFLRVRSLAEHACTEPMSSPNARDPLRNTRTTRAGLLARLTVAPHHVNYHLEHHLLMTVPHYKLPRMRAMLVERGAVPAEAPSYADVLRWVGAG